MSELLIEYGQKAFENVKTEMGERWNLLTDVQKASAERSSRRVIELDLEAREGKNVAEDLEFVKATVKELSLMAEIASSDVFWDAFWKGVNEALGALGTFLVNAGKAAIGINVKGLINE